MGEKSLGRRFLNIPCLAFIRRAQATKKRGLVCGFHHDFAGGDVHFVQLAL